jgi:cobalt/nickel transport system permease protein
MSAHAINAVGVAGDPASPVHRLDPRAKLIGLTGVTVVAVSVPAPAWPVLVACAAALAAVAVAARVPARTLAARGAVVLPLLGLLALTLPFRPDDGAVVLTAAKALTGTASAVLLGATTSFPDVLHALERLRAPVVATTIAALMYRYLFVIADEARRMRVALKARAYAPRTALQAGAIGRVAVALFLRSHDRGERVHLAMRSRGHAGSLPRLRALALGRADVAFLAALACALVPLRVALGVAA